jgi:hypothetical protein
MVIGPDLGSNLSVIRTQDGKELHVQQTVDQVAALLTKDP